MEKRLPLEELSISQIFMIERDKLTYLIPIYQRNYAWEDDEINALIKDIYDSFKKDQKRPYYIGTLVTYNRGENVYEVIDGQQRLTTIYIILNVLGLNYKCNRLTYEARKRSATTIDRLNNYPTLGDEVDSGIRNGYEFAKKAIETIVSSDDYDIFKSYFLHKVHIIHYQVPKDVDLNHHFEVMNSRGEQLEKQEIVKSLLSQHLKDNAADLATFSRVWEACSDMSSYIQQTFPEPSVFGQELNRLSITDFKAIPHNEESSGKSSILTLIQQPIESVRGEEDMEKRDRFQPIIDFPNFLLIVLKITRMEEDKFDPTQFILDDKELLSEFHEAFKGHDRDDDKAEFSKRFAFNLLKAKFLLDNYIIHHVLNDRELLGDNPWKVQCYQLSHGRRYPKNLYEKREEQDELVHLLSMFEVSFTPKQHKNYLFYCLMYLFENMNATSEAYLDFLRSLADNYFYGVYLNKELLNDRNQPKPNAFDRALLISGKLRIYKKIDRDTDYKESFGKIYKQGSSNISLFVFNYMDYKLWKMYADRLRGNENKKGSPLRNEFFASLGCRDFGLEPFDEFYFSRTRKSLEHFYPKAKAVNDEKATPFMISKSQINCFGNFAMIGAEANSYGLNWDPKTKLDHYTDSKMNPVSVASLKFRIMMQICNDNQSLNRTNGMEWNAEDMIQHQNMMLQLIFH